MSCHEKVSSGQYHLVMAYLRNPRTWISEEKKSVTRGDFCLLLPTMSLSWRGHLWFFNILVWTPAVPLSVNSFQDSKPPASRNVWLQSCVLAAQLGKALLDFTVCLPPALLRTPCSGVTNGWNALLGRVSAKYKEPEKNELTVWLGGGVCMKFKPNVLKN